MAFGAELIARLGLDTSAWNRGLAQVQADSSGLGKALDRKLGKQDAFKGLVAGLGISIESIAEKIAEAWVGGTKAGLEGVSQLLDQETAQIEKNIFDRMPDEKARRAFIERAMKRATEERDSPRKSTTETVEFPADEYGRGGEKKDIVTFTETEEAYETRVAAARLRIAELESTQIAAKNKDKEDTKNLDREIAEAKEKNAEVNLNNEEKLDRAKAKQYDAWKAMQAAEAGTTAKKKAILDHEKAMLRTEELIRDVKEDQKRQTEEELRLAEKAEALAKRIRDLQKSESAAVAGVAGARQDLAGGRHDALSVSIQDAAAGKGVTQTNKAAARRILNLEAQAKRVMQSGGAGMRDYSGQPISAEGYAKKIQTRAEALRAKAGFLSTAEQNPFAAAEATLRNSEAHLKEIRASLKEEQAKK